MNPLENTSMETPGSSGHAGSNADPLRSPLAGDSEAGDVGFDAIDSGANSKIPQGAAVLVLVALVGGGAQVSVTDPQGRKEGEALLPGVTWAADAYEAAEGADAVVLLTEWNQFRAIDLKRLKSIMAGDGFADLMSRIGGRIGLENIIRPLPADSHIPEKGWTDAAAAWSAAPEDGWPGGGPSRPVLMLRPEPAEVRTDGRRPLALRWRRSERRLAAAFGPERIAPEWWLDDPAWRSGPRDYWRVEDEEGRRLWLFLAHGGEVSGGWFVHGEMA